MGEELPEGLARGIRKGRVTPATPRGWLAAHMPTAKLTDGLKSIEIIQAD
ncbi:MAG: hypothetical protein Q8L05_06875 [Actinomycetota bacterium]|nr:hypothetical protein [Actinomycetota bacterium]MDP2288891.1 hypothetical protein [Actinomycetota bacterium]